MKMQFEDFTKEVVARVRDFLPEEMAEKASVSLQVITKNNDLKLTGLTITSVESNVAPTIYLDKFYQDFEAGEEMETILRRIAEFRMNHEVTEKFDAESITDYSRCCNQIIPRLVSSEMNAELLATRPHTLMGDLAVTYHIQLSKCNDGTASIPVSNDLLRTWGMTTEEIHMQALKNLPVVAPSTFKGMNEVMTEMLMPNFINECDGDEDAAREMMETMLPMVDEKMFVLSNAQKMHGASALLDKDMMEKVASRVGNDFFILPSSVHEVLIIPADAGMDVEELEAMVHEVNTTQVDLPDRLSEHVFKYSADAGIYRA